MPRQPISFKIETTINALPTATVVYPAELCCDLVVGDSITLPCDDCLMQNWIAQEIEIALDDEGRKVANVTLASEVEGLRRCAVSSEAVFADLSVQDVISNLVTYAHDEIGLDITIAYVHLATFNFTSKFNPSSKNLIEVLRESAALTGNSFRFDGTVVEFGTFGDASGYVLRSGVSRPVSGKGVFFQNASYRIDDSETIGCLYVEGGTYTGSGDQTLILKLGSIAPPWQAIPPAGYTLTQVTRLGQIEWRLCKTGGNNLSARINVPGIMPDVESGVIPSVAQQQAAAQALMDAAIEYLDSHSIPVLTWEADVPGCLCDLKVGDTARIMALCADQPLAPDPLYVTSITINWNGGKVVTHVTLSSVLDDQDHSLDRTFGAGISDKTQTPIPRSSSHVVTVIIPPGAPCDGPNSSGAVVTFGVTYAAIPLVQASTTQGVITLSGITTSQATVCVKTDPAPFPLTGVTITLSISGTSA